MEPVELKYQFVCMPPGEVCGCSGVTTECGCFFEADGSCEECGGLPVLISFDTGEPVGPDEMDAALEQLRVERRS